MAYNVCDLGWAGTTSFGPENVRNVCDISAHGFDSAHAPHASRLCPGNWKESSMNRLMRVLLFCVCFLAVPAATFGQAYNAKAIPPFINKRNEMFAWALNDSGMVTGYANVTPPHQETWHGFFWSPATGSVDLGTLGAYYSYGFGINNGGEVVGSSNFNSNWEVYQAFVWDSSSGMELLGPPEGGSSASGINDAGEVVGCSNGTAFLWTEATGMQTLPISQACANAINNAGQVVGYCCSYSYDNESAFLWSATGGFVNLGTLSGYVGSSATAIDSNADVVGALYAANGAVHGFFGP